MLNLHKPHYTTWKIAFIVMSYGMDLKEWILAGYPLREGTLLGSFLLWQKVIEQRLTFDEMMGASGVFTNDAGKQFFSGNYNRKMLV